MNKGIILSVAKFDLNGIDKENDEGEKTVPIIHDRHILIGTARIIEAQRRTKSIRLRDYTRSGVDITKQSLYVKGELTVLTVEKSDGMLVTYDLYDDLEVIRNLMNRPD